MGILLFGGGIAAGLFFYIKWAQGNYFGIVRTSIRRGLTIPDAKEVPAFAALVGLDAPLPRIRIDGEAVVIVGETSEFKAFGQAEGADEEAPVSTAQWSTDPEDSAKLEAGGQSGLVGASVKLTATKKGVFTLKAEAEGFAPGEVTVTAIVAPAHSPDVAFVGRGYGTIIIGIAILSIAGALAAIDALSSEAVATLFGALAGFIFLKSAVETGTPPEQQQQPEQGSGQSTPPPGS